MYRMLALAMGLMCSSVAFAQDNRQSAETFKPNPVVDTDYELDKRRDQGWNAPWGLVFSFTNILQNGSFLTNFQNLSVAGSLILSPDFMIRGGATVSRTSTPPQTTETSLTTPDTTVKTYARPDPGQTSSFNVALRAEGIYRLTRNKVAPYVGGGPYVSFGQTRDSVTDDVSVPNVTTSIRNRTTTVSAGLRALVGAEWRIHSNFAFFAEYGLSLDVVTFRGVNNATSTVSTIDGAKSGATTRTITNTPAWLNLSTGLTQGATLGLIVFF